jgi:putative NADH-flavin reductase
VRNSHAGVQQAEPAAQVEAKGHEVSDEKGSSISYEDSAIALADGTEAPKHARQRFTVGY